MTEIESTDRDHVRDGKPGEGEAYEPPRITSLGTVDELTTGGNAPGGDTGSMSIGGAADGTRRHASGSAPAA
jgi:hypothetical protein